MKTLLATILSLTILCTESAASLKVFFSTSNSPSALWRLPLNGTPPTKLRGLPNAGRSVAFDSVSGDIYYQVASTGLFKNGSLFMDEDLWDFDLDAASGYIYHVDSDYGGSIYRTPTNGASRELIWTKPSSISRISSAGIALDTSNGHVYVGDTALDQIWRINFDGSGLTTVVSFGSNVELQDVAVAGGKLYWADQSLNKIQRSNLDGTSIEDVVSSVNARRIAIDQAGGKIYWGSPEGSSGSGSTFTITRQGGLWRANLDGTSEELVLASDGDIHGIAFGSPGSPNPSIPEPSSLLTWSLLAGWAGGIVRRSQLKRTGGRR